jgi:selenide, water dikinase
MMIEPIQLTQYSKGAGCGCKIAPQVLQQILQSTSPLLADPRLLVGNQTADDAAVYSLGDGQALISTTDFFMPIVNDPFAFGQIAAANAISDVYAMGGKPIMALAILGWPLQKIDPLHAAQVLEGARKTCAEAGITLAGGHTIESEEPIFGLSVNGLVTENHLKRNSSAKVGDVLFLTKAIGIGVLATALKKELLNPEQIDLLMKQLTLLNSVGEKLGRMQGVNAMTDVTGFGLLGHLIEMCEGSGCSANIDYVSIPKLIDALPFLAQRIVPDATYRNWNGYGSKVGFATGINVMEAFNLLPDPQTNGGLLISVQAESAPEVQALLASHPELHCLPIGIMIESTEKVVNVV